MFHCPTFMQLLFDLPEVAQSQVGCHGILPARLAISMHHTLWATVLSMKSQSTPRHRSTLSSCKHIMREVGLQSACVSRDRAACTCA